MALSVMSDKNADFHSSPNASKALEDIFKALDPLNRGKTSRTDFARVLNLAGVQQERVPRKHQALLERYGDSANKKQMDYERFLLDGQCAQLRGIGDHVVPPVEPWAEEKKKRTRNPPPLANSTANTSASDWQAHVRAFQQRRVVAGCDIFRFVQKARRHKARRDGVQRRLERDALRASTIVLIGRVVKTASKQCRAHNRAKSWLNGRLFHARRHALRRKEALHRLAELGAWTIAAALADARDATNQNRIWHLSYLTKQATKFLMGVASQQVSSNDGKRGALLHLASIAKKAIEMRPVLAKHQERLAQLGIKASAQRRKREGVLIRCFRKSDRARLALGQMQEAQVRLEEIGEKCGDALEFRGGAVAYLQSMGRSVAVVVFKDQLTGWWLSDIGKQGVRHMVAQGKAREYLSKRRDDGARSKQEQMDTVKTLTSLAQAAITYWINHCEVGMKYLDSRVIVLRSGHKVALMRAKVELKEALNYAHITRALARIAVEKPQKIAEMASQLKRVDMKNDRERKPLGAKDRLRLEMLDVFNHYNLSGSGEIGRFEFLAMMKSGRIFTHITSSEVEDVFNMMDKDRSGAINFEELWSWVQFELTKLPGKAKGLTVANMLPIRERAARMVLQEIKN